MTIKLYHAEPAANSLKALIALKEKGLEFESNYVDLHKFEQHEPWFVEINPEGQVPVLVHDGNTITHTTVINEYLDDVFPQNPLRPADAAGKAHMRYWNKYIDEHVMESTSMHGWHRMVGVIARSIDTGDFAKLLEKIPLERQRKKWMTARSGFTQEQLDEATGKIVHSLEKVEAQLGKSPWLVGDMYTYADINYFAYCGMFVHMMFPELKVDETYPKMADWRERMRARKGVEDALNMPDHTSPALRTFTGEAR